MAAPGDSQAQGPQPSAIVSIPRAIHYAADQISPPAYLHVQQEDDILVKVFAPTIALPFSINVEFRVLYPANRSQPEAEIRPTRKTILVNATSVTQRFTLNEGFILSASASMAAGATAVRGQVFCQMFVVRGISTDLITLWTLLSDYVTTNFRPTWPNAGPRGPLEGPGNLRSIQGTTPGAGAEISESCPTGARWRLQGLESNFAASAVVANRTPSFILDDGANFYWHSQDTVVVTASQAADYTFGPQALLAQAAGNNARILPTPNTPFVLAGWRIRSSVSNIQAGDQWQQPKYVVEEWVEA